MIKERFQMEQNNEAGKDIAKFPHNLVELKWMNRWDTDQLYRANDNSEKPSCYIVDMYPYPSGSGLHVGHVEGYTATDILSRYKRMNGFEVLHPMGWDAFGLPTENYAIKTGRDPHEITAENAEVFRGQCKRAGFSIDWSREIDTSKPEYYKWTQQIFLDLYEHDLAYKAKSPVNWCTGCQTVVANEQVVDAHCERCDSAVESRNIEQWYFKITAYADRLLEDLDHLDWPESTKERQKNWIGRTEGVEVPLSIKLTDGDITVFTPEPEEFGKSSIIALAPEYPALDRIVSDEQKQYVTEYISTMTPQSEVQRKKQKNNTGVFTGNYAINPITGLDMEIWITDHVLMDEYGGVKIEPVEDVTRNEMVSLDRKTALDLLGDKAKPTVRYKLRDWLVSRERYWGAPIPIIHCDSCGDQPVQSNQLPVLLPHMDDFKPTGVPPLARSKEFLHTTCPHCGGKAERETKTLDTFVDSAWYLLRYADPHNNNALADKQLLNKWLPVDVYMGGSDHATGHLLYTRFITKFLSDIGKIDINEPAARLMHQGLIMGSDGRKMSKRWGNAVNPMDVSNAYGSDALRIFEMFLGPIEQSKIWDTNAIIGSRRFVDKVWQLQNKVQEQTSKNVAAETNVLIENVTKAIESERFNVAVSDFMKYVNFIEKSGSIDKQSYETFLKLLAPFAPFITEELWEYAGNKYSIHQTTWPEPMILQETMKKIITPVMINNKVVGTFELPEGSEMSEEDVLTFLQSNEQFSDKLKDIKDIKKIVFKPGKVCNIVV